MRAASSITSRTSFILVALLLLATAAVQPLAAQILRGTVRDSATNAPITGAVLVLLDSSGASLGRNITNERGDYSIALNSAMRRIQVLRIGFRPRTVRIPAVVDGGTRLDVSMPSIPRLLESVSVIDQPNCPRRDGRAQAFALWEQARAALLAVVVAREANPATVTRLHAVRHSTLPDREPATQTVKIDIASTPRPFAASRKAEDFVQRGFSYDSAGTTWFNGPDADTMLDDAFVRGYCFHVASPDTTRPKHVGLAFAPADRKRGRIDIEGTVWIDSTSLSLTDIEFRYVGTPAFMDPVKPGGRVSFRSMANGTAIVDRWTLRSGGFVRTPSGRMNARQLLNAPLDVQESIGAVANARWDDGLQWHASLGTLRGRLADSARAGVQIRLIDTDYRAVTDSAGRFEIPQLLPGPYQIGVIDPAFAEINLILMTNQRFVAAGDSVSEVSVDAPTPGNYLAGVCRESKGVNGASALVLRIELPNGGPANDATVEMRAFADGNMRRIAEGKTDRNGLFHACNPPRHVQLTLRVNHDQAQPVYLTTEVVDQLKVENLQLKPRR